MKTVSGKVVSSQQISLSKAAKYLSRFTASDNEASPAFEAYLRRTSAAFDELNKLHREYKIPLRDSKDKKDHSTGIVTQGTANSAATTHVEIKRERTDVGDGIEAVSNINAGSKNVSYDSSIGIGLEVQHSEKTVEGHVLDVGGVKKAKKKRECSSDVADVKYQHDDDHAVIKVDYVKNEKGSLGGKEEVKMNMADVGVVDKKSKKKKGSDVDVAFIDKVKPNGGYDAINVSQVKDEMTSLDASEEVKNNVPDVNGVSKKSKKKKGSGAPLSFTDKDQSHNGIRTDEMGSLDASEERKKKKEKKRDKKYQKDVKESGSIISAEQKDNKNEVKEERERGSARSAEQGLQRNLENKDKVNGEEKQKKKRNEAEERGNKSNVEPQVVDKKASRKRKHEGGADGEFNGSEEAVRPKKKKTVK